MTHIDSVRQPGTILVDGATLDRLDAISVATGRTHAELIAVWARDGVVATDAAASSAGAVSPGQGTAASTPAPTIAFTYTDPDGDTLALVPLEGRPADWAVRITTADPDGELDVFIEDDDAAVSVALSWINAVEDRRR